MTAEINVRLVLMETLDDEADIMSPGRLIHSFGQAQANDRLHRLPQCV